MRAVGNILLLPLKAILLAGFIFSLAGFILTTVFDHLSNVILGSFISICIILIIASLALHGTGITENPASIMIIVAFVLSIISMLIPFIFQGLMSFFKNGLSFWF